MRRFYLPFIVILATACKAEMERPRMDGPSEGDTSVATAADGSPRVIQPRPATRADTVRLEGELERVTTRLVQSPAGFPLSFSTYMPAEMELEEISHPTGQALRLVWPFRDRREPGVTLVVYPEGTSVADAVTAERRARDGRFSLEDRSIEQSWSHTAFSFRELNARPTDALVGWLGFGIRRGRAFSIGVQYFAEMGDGLGPRADLMLRRWRWEDTGDLLR